MLTALLLTIALDTTSPKAKTADALDDVQLWIDTVSDHDNGNYQYLTPGEKIRERKHLNEKGPYTDPFPTRYPSPFKRPQLA